MIFFLLSLGFSPICRLLLLPPLPFFNPFLPPLRPLSPAPNLLLPRPLLNVTFSLRFASPPSYLSSPHLFVFDHFILVFLSAPALCISICVSSSVFPSRPLRKECALDAQIHPAVSTLRSINQPFMSLSVSSVSVSDSARSDTFQKHPTLPNDATCRKI